MHAGWMALRTLQSDQSVKDAKLKPGTIRRIFSYSSNYRIDLIFFVISVIVDAVLVISTPLLLKDLIDKGVIPKDSSVVVRLSLLVGIIAVANAAINMWNRWYSAKIGEGLIYDLRSQVFNHVQKQSIAFFTRTQTGEIGRAHV